jgi:hypothetical protein
LIGMGSLPVKRLRQFMPNMLKYIQGKRIKPQAAHKNLVWIENRLTDWQTACLIFVLLTVCLFAWSLT